MTNPTKERDHLADPNYYRLGFQLVAQSLNRDVPRRFDPEPRPRLAAEMTATTKSHDVLEVASEVLADAEAMLAWYDARATRPRWRRRFSRLEPHEEKLRDFLACTVEPCTRVALAVALRERERHDAARDQLVRVLERVEAEAVSYRVHYSLACWYARATAYPMEHPSRQSVELALANLLRAFRDAPRARAYELADWAMRDPALERVRSDERESDTFLWIVATHTRPRKGGDRPDRPR